MPNPNWLFFIDYIYPSLMLILLLWYVRRNRCSNFGMFMWAFFAIGVTPMGTFFLAYLYYNIKESFHDATNQRFRWAKRINSGG